MKSSKKHTVKRKELKFNYGALTYTLQLKIGNNKPIDTDTSIISMSSAVNCSNKTCPYHIKNTGDCYGLKYELNKRFMKNTLIRRLKDQLTIEKLVQDPNGAEKLAAKILETNKKARSYNIKFQRWNETGELLNLQYLIFVNNTADILYKKAGIITSIYTHRKDIYQEFKQLNIQSKGLIILGSGFMADIMFRARDPEAAPTPGAKQCSGNCIECKHQNGGEAAYCYDIKLKGKGVIIEESLRTNNNNLDKEIPQDIQNQLNQIKAYYGG